MEIIISYCNILICKNPDLQTTGYMLLFATFLENNCCKPVLNYLLMNDKQSTNLQIQSSYVITSLGGYASVRHEGVCLLREWWGKCSILVKFIFQHLLNEHQLFIM